MFNREDFERRFNLIVKDIEKLNDELDCKSAFLFVNCALPDLKKEEEIAKTLEETIKKFGKKAESPTIHMPTFYYGDVFLRTVLICMVLKQYNLSPDILKDIIKNLDSIKYISDH